jgi:hypothetical protein
VLAKELVALEADVIIGQATPGNRAAGGRCHGIEHNDRSTSGD